MKARTKQLCPQPKAIVLRLPAAALERLEAECVRRQAIFGGSVTYTPVIAELIYKNFPVKSDPARSRKSAQAARHKGTTAPGDTAAA